MWFFDENDCILTKLVWYPLVYLCCMIFWLGSVCYFLIENSQCDWTVTTQGRYMSTQGERLSRNNLILSKLPKRLLLNVYFSSNYLCTASIFFIKLMLSHTNIFDLTVHDYNFHQNISMNFFQVLWQIWLLQHCILL